MELIRYLNDGFLTQEQLLAAAAIDQASFENLQQRNLMPRPSYTLNLDVSCNSIFGPHREQLEVAYYARNYLAWIDLIRSLSSNEDAFQVFSARYKARLQDLFASGLTTHHEKVNAGLDAHIVEEWGHFLDGTYGLCTKSGLPDDIAAKELAVLIVKEITEERYDKALSPAERDRLTAAVNLLDAASAPFAPHERLRSSRYRLVDQVRSSYGV